MRCKNVKRRGVTSLVEVVLSMAIFAVLIAVLLSLMAYSSSAMLKSQFFTKKMLDTDFFIEMLQEDVKNAETIDFVDGGLHLSGSSALVIYHTEDTTLFRNDEVVAKGISSVFFLPEDEDTVSVYLRTEDDEMFNFIISR